MNLNTLQNLGISEKAAKIYLATLALGTAAVKDIALKSELKRPTVYVHLGELLNAGLLEKYPSGKKEYYKATDPKKLLARATHNLKEVEYLIPELTALQGSVAGRPQVSILEGRSALLQVYEEICRANSICFWSDLKAVEIHFSQMFIKIAESIKLNEIRTREIIADTAEAKSSNRRFAATAGKTYASRLAVKSGINNDNAIFGDTLAIFRIQQNNLFVVLIKEPTIAATMKTMFDMAWESAAPFIGR